MSSVQCPDAESFRLLLLNFVVLRERSTVACSPIWICRGSLALNFSTGFATEEWRSHRSS